MPFCSKLANKLDKLQLQVLMAMVGLTPTKEETEDLHRIHTRQEKLATHIVWHVSTWSECFAISTIN